MKKLYIIAIMIGLVAGMTSICQAQEYNFRMGKYFVRNEVVCIEGYKWLFINTSDNNPTASQMTENIEIRANGGSGRLIQVLRVNIPCGGNNE